ncbi:hypothetical protein HPB47_004585, partial [Ixodes persulcatus]
MIFFGYRQTLPGPIRCTFVVVAHSQRLSSNVERTYRPSSFYSFRHIRILGREGESYYHIDFTHPLGPLYWAEVLYVVQTTRDLISAGQLLLEQPKCARPPKLSLPCPADTEVGTWQKASSQSDELCGTARLHLSTYRDLKFAYPYLLAEMTHRSARQAITFVIVHANMPQPRKLPRRDSLPLTAVVAHVTRHKAGA